MFAINNRLRSMTRKWERNNCLAGRACPIAPWVAMFAHGSGSSRVSSRNQLIAQQLQDCGLAPLLFDLLHEHESPVRRNVLDIGPLSGQLTEWLELAGGIQADLQLSNWTIWR